MGANVHRHHTQEIGWTRVFKSLYCKEGDFQLPEHVDVMQWHSETFDLPKGAIRLAENSVCHNQVYQIGNNVLGFQFHPEITPQALKLFVAHEEEQNVFYGKNQQSLRDLEQSDKTAFIPGHQSLNRAIEYVLQP